jgi:hypothetical protein
MMANTRRERIMGITNWNNYGAIKTYPSTTQTPPPIEYKEKMTGKPDF